jgi:surface carbohydrate biosynthesis protein
MTNGMPSTLIIPVENQVRELDAKLLLSCVAAERGFPVIMGSRAYVHFRLASIPRGVYLAKSMRGLSTPVFRFLRQLGHEIVAWDEEALVHPPPDIYFTLRLAPKPMKYVSRLLAWGEENVELFRRYPYLPAGIPIHATGNARSDMLRAELRPYFAEEVERLRAVHGDFILVNTNFTDVNPFIPAVGLFLPGKHGKGARFGQMALGMTREFAEGMRDHRQAVFEDFKALIPFLEQAFPDHAIVVRPHPSEHHGIYDAIAQRHSRIRVINEGSVIPWLLACKAMVHNGCTTGVEAYVLRVPAVSFMATENRYYDYDFNGLPNRASHRCSTLEELRETLQRILTGELGAAGGRERERLVGHYLAALDGPLACERIVDVLEAAGYANSQPPEASAFARAQGWLFTHLRTALVQVNMRRPGPNRLAYHDHRFPELPVAAIEERIGRLGRLLNRFEAIRVEPWSKHVFSISSADRRSQRGDTGRTATPDAIHKSAAMG